MIIIWPGTPAFRPGQTLHNSFANFGALMTNDGAVESSHQGEIVFAHLTGGRDNYKKNMCQGQTDSIVQTPASTRYM